MALYSSGRAKQSWLVSKEGFPSPPGTRLPPPWAWEKFSVIGPLPPTQPQAQPWRRSAFRKNSRYVYAFIYIYICGACGARWWWWWSWSEWCLGVVFWCVAVLYVVCEVIGWFFRAFSWLFVVLCLVLGICVCVRKEGSFVCLMGPLVLS